MPSGTYTSGQVILFSPIITSQMGSWLKTLLQLYEKWRITKLAMRYVPSVGSTQPGNIMMFFDPDPTNNWGTYTAGPDLIKRAFTLAGRVDFSLWQTTTAQSPPSQWLWTQAQGSDPRLFQAGSFVVLCVTGFTVANDFGALHMDWSVEAVNKSYNQAAFTMTSAFTSMSAFNPDVNFWLAGASMAPMAGGGGLLQAASTSSLALGVPLAYMPAALTAGYSMTAINGGTAGTPAAQGPIIAFPAGEYIVNCGLVANEALPGNILTPAHGPGVTITSQDCGFGATNGGTVANCANSTCIIEVIDDADSSAIPIDVSNALTIVDNTTMVNTVVPATNDWGFFDVIADIVGIGVSIVDVFFDAVDVVAPILGAFLVTSRHSAPNCHAYLSRRHTAKVVRYNAGLGMGLSVQERILLDEFRKFKVSKLGPLHEPNRPVPVPMAVVSSKDERKEPLSPVYTTMHGDDLLVHTRKSGATATNHSSIRRQQEALLRTALDKLTGSQSD